MPVGDGGYETLEDSNNARLFDLLGYSHFNGQHYVQN